jgi:hypothetical protein
MSLFEQKPNNGLTDISRPTNNSNSHVHPFSRTSMKG